MGFERTPLQPAELHSKRAEGAAGGRWGGASERREQASGGNNGRAAPSHAANPGFECRVSQVFLPAPDRYICPRSRQLTMLCNCAWRFKNFNIDHPEIQECRSAYLELQERIEALEVGSRIRNPRLAAATACFQC